MAKRYNLRVILRDIVKKYCILWENLSAYYVTMFKILGGGPGNPFIFSSGFQFLKKTFLTD